MKTTVSRRAMMTSIPAAAMMPAAAQPNGAPVPHFATADPVFAAIEQHRQAIQARIPEHDEDTSQQLLNAEGDALLAWLTTSPVTMEGVLATLDHASARQPWPASWRPYGDTGCTNLLESADCDGERLAAIEQFPAMIAAALRQIVG